MIEQILVIALVTLGYCCIFWEGMIFEQVGNWMECHAPEWLWKPLGGCYVCACMWIGSVAYWLLYVRPVHTFDILDWFITCVGAMGVNAGISLFADKERKVEMVEDVKKDSNDFDIKITYPSHADLQVHAKQEPNRQGPTNKHTDPKTLLSH